MKRAIDHFGGIDIVINDAWAIALQTIGTLAYDRRLGDAPVPDH